MDIVNEPVHPHAAGVLVEAHGPVGRDLLLRVGIGLGEFFKLLRRNLGELGDIFERVGLDRLRVFLEADLREFAFGPVLRRLLARIVSSQPVADIGRRLGEIDVLVQEVLVVGLVLDDVVGNVVGNCQIGLRFEHHAIVGQFEIAIVERRQHMHLAPGLGQPGVGQPRPENGVHLRHVGAPEHEDIRMLEIVVAAHRLVDAEGAHEGAHGRGHAMPSVGFQAV